MGTKLTELRDGCFHRAMDDEPMFVLLGRDPSAPDIVEAWARTRESEIERQRRPRADMAQVIEARETAQRMRDWRTANDGAWRVDRLDLDGVTTQDQAMRLAKHDLNKSLGIDRLPTPAQSWEVERINTDSGHGHVWERPDGMKARCGGPALCSICERDQKILDFVPGAVKL